MSVQINKPVRVSFKTSPARRIVKPEFAKPYIKTTKCDWGKIFENRLIQQYPDMIITREKEGEDKEVFVIELKGRSTKEADVRIRVQNFLSNNPSMKLSEFELAYVR